MNESLENFEELVNAWMPYHKQFIKESTYSNYINIIDNHLLRDFSGKKLFEFNNHLIQEYVIHKCLTGSVSGKELSVKTVKDIMVVLKLILRFSFSNNNSTSFDLNIKYPKMIKNQKPMTIYNKDIKKIVKTVYESKDSRDFGILVSLLTGLRIGEICALRYKDICFNNNSINVSRTLQRIYTKKDRTRIIETTPKTSSSIREIPLSKEIKRFLNTNIKDIEFFILTNSLNPVEPRLLRNRFNYILRKNRLRHYTFHTLRHTFATKCIEIKIDYKTISVLLGHSNINTTLNLYVHPNSSQKKKAINKLTASIIN